MIAGIFGPTQPYLARNVGVRCVIKWTIQNLEHLVILVLMIINAGSIKIIIIMIKVSVDTINFIWTGRSIGFMITSVLTALVFKQYCR